MKVRIDEVRCTGHGRCYVVAPDLFRDDESGYGHVAGEGTVDAANRVNAERARAACPEQAIHLEDGD